MVAPSRQRLKRGHGHPSVVDVGEEVAGHGRPGRPPGCAGRDGSRGRGSARATAVDQRPHGEVGHVEVHPDDVAPVGARGRRSMAPTWWNRLAICDSASSGTRSLPGSRAAMTLDASSGPPGGAGDRVGVVEPSISIERRSCHPPSLMRCGSVARPRTRLGDRRRSGRRRSCSRPRRRARAPTPPRAPAGRRRRRPPRRARPARPPPLVVADDDVAGHHRDAGTGDRDLVVERHVQATERRRVRRPVVDGDVEAGSPGCRATPRR